eukprot:5955706-Pyramimonas_sp.AAC.1
MNHLALAASSLPPILILFPRWVRRRRRMWCNLCGATYVAQPMCCSPGGATCVVQPMGCNIGCLLYTSPSPRDRSLS